MPTDVDAVEENSAIFTIGSIGTVGAIFAVMDFSNTAIGASYTGKVFELVDVARGCWGWR